MSESQQSELKRKKAMEEKQFVENHFKVFMNFELFAIKDYLKKTAKKMEITQEALLLQTKEGRGRLAIHFLAARGDLEIFKYVYDICDQSQSVDEEGNNPMFAAVQHNQYEIMKYLHEEKKVPLDTLRKGNVSLLHLAASNGVVEVLDYLLQNNLNIEQNSDDLGTPVNWAVSFQQPKALKFLIDKGASLQKNTKIEQLPPPLIMALNQQNFEIVEIILDANKECVHDKDQEGWTALHFAAELGDMKSTQELIKRGADPNYECQGQTAADLAFVHEKWDIVSYLRELTNKAVDESQKTITITEEDKQKSIEKKNEGNALFSAKEFEKAIEKYTEAIELNNKNEIYFTNRSASYINLKRYEEALKDCKAAKRINPKYLKAYFREGEAYFGLGNYGDSAASYWEGLRLEPMNQALKFGFDQSIRIGKEQHQSSLKK